MFVFSEKGYLSINMPVSSLSLLLYNMFISHGKTYCWPADHSYPRAHIGLQLLAVHLYGSVVHTVHNYEIF